MLRGNGFLERWHGWYKLAGRKFPAGANLAAVSRNSDHMEVWSIGKDGQVHGIWYDDSKWRDWYTLPGASFMPGVPLAAVSRHPDLMEVWGIDNHGPVRDQAELHGLIDKVFNLNLTLLGVNLIKNSFE